MILAKLVVLLPLALLVGCAAPGAPLLPDLPTLASGKGWSGELGAVSVANEEARVAAVFAQSSGEGKEKLVWLDGYSFANGVIEFDAKGQAAPAQSSFVGIAIRVADAKNYDAIFFRPFNFQAAKQENRERAVQYVSMPDFPWQRLRKERPAQFEQSIAAAPDGNSWFHARIVVKRPKLSVFVNGASEPSLVVDELSPRAGGSVGLWANGVGRIANLKITPTP